MPQELIGIRQARILSGREKLFVTESRKREKCSTMPHPGFAASVQTLEALDKEFDIADPAFASLTSSVEVTSRLRLADSFLFRSGCFRLRLLFMDTARVSETASTRLKSVVVR